MESRKPNPLRWLVLGVILVAVAYTLYTQRRQDIAEPLEAQIRGVIRDMDLSPEWEAEVLRLAEQAHAQAFDKAMDVTQGLGRKFDENAYFTEVFDRAIAMARESGMDRLADSLDRQRQHFRLTVVEQ